MKITYQDKTFEVEKKTKISDALKEQIKKSKYAVVGAKFNNEYKDLSYELDKDGTVELVDISMKEGTKIYRRTLIYIMGMAFSRVCPEALITVDYQLSNEMFCEVDNMEVTKELIQAVRDEMIEIINKNLAIEKRRMNRKEAEKFLKTQEQ